jgi:hypothetical protein
MCWKVARQGVSFAKPHGSASWTLDVNFQRVVCPQPDAVPLCDSLATQDVESGREPLVLGAVSLKSELVKEVQERYGVERVFKVVAAQWRAVVEAIRDSETLIVAGYSFPAEDQYGRFMFKEAVRLRTGSIRVEFFERTHRQAEMAKVLSEVFESRVSELVFRGEVKPGAT